MLRGEHGIAEHESHEAVNGHENGHAHIHRHSHSAPAANNASFRSRTSGSENGSSFGSCKRDAHDTDTPRTSSEGRTPKKISDISTRSPLEVTFAHEVSALRNHVKILEERLRNERHSHAARFSEIEKQLIQENAKLKVSTSALQRQVKREQQQVTDHEAELTRLKKQEKKGRFSLSGITRSFSDAKLEDIEMKESTLKRKSTESEIIRTIRERLDDSEKDRAETETIFNQRISGILRERNLQRADMRSAEETIMKLTAENEALHKSLEVSRVYISKSSNGVDSDPVSTQVALLKRANQQLQEELDHLSREKLKLLDDLETLSEEVTISKANERQTQQVDGALAVEMKLKIDSLRSKLALLEREKTATTKKVVRNDSFSSSISVRSETRGPSTSGSPTVSATQKILELETQLKQKQRELVDHHRKLVSILELSQRYEYHCYELEKKLSQVYGKNYQFVETDWRKNDVDFIKSLRQVVKHDSESQTVEIVHRQNTKPKSHVTTQTSSTASQHRERNPQLDELLEKVNGMIHMIERVSPSNSPLAAQKRAGQGTAMAAAFDDLLRSVRSGQSNQVDLTKLTEARLEIQTLQRAFRALEGKNKDLEQQIHRLQQSHDDQWNDEGLDPDRPIAQEEIDAVIRKAQIQAAAIQPTSSFQHIPVLIASNPFAPLESPVTNYTSSGIWTSPWSSGSTFHDEDHRTSLEDRLPPASSFY